MISQPNIEGKNMGREQTFNGNEKTGFWWAACDETMEILVEAFQDPWMN